MLHALACPKVIIWCVKRTNNILEEDKQMFLSEEEDGPAATFI